jgi:1-acyl-sn-glycerol-3-phosphate acyltransferase
MLLEARKTAPLDRLYAAYGRRLLRRAFAAVWLGGAQWPDDRAPAIAVLNHSAWWDPIVALFLSHDLFRRDGYGIMQGAQLERFPFFRRVGAFGASSDSLQDARNLADYAARVLRAGSRRTLWVFPQGALVPARAPLRFRSGAARIARLVPEATVVPLALRYEQRAEQRPELFVRVGEPLRAAGAGGPAGVASDGASGAARPGELTRCLERRVAAALRQLDADLERPVADGYARVLRGRGSVSEWYERRIRRVRGEA